MELDRQTLESYYTVENALKLSIAEAFRLNFKYMNPVRALLERFAGPYKKFVKAEGIYYIDEQGKKYLDFFGSFGAMNLGHEPPEVLKALKDIEGQPNILQITPNPFAGKLAEFLAKITPGALSRTYFCNSGTEAVEAAIKIARCYTGKKILVYTKNAFHGKTMGALSVSGKDKYKIPFQPLVPDTTMIPYNDLSALEEELHHENVAAFIVEPIQGEAGVIIPSTGYLKGAEQLCRKYGVLFIVDEVQTGMGRTGMLFCCEYENAEPDIMCLSKCLGGGVMPIGAMITTDTIWKRSYGSIEKYLLQTSTFGSNSRACACGIAALNAIISKNLPRNAREQGEYLLPKLMAFKERFSIVKDVRGKGLMIGIQLCRLKGKRALVEGGMMMWVIRQLFHKHSIVSGFSLNNYDVMRILPPLIINREQIDIFLNAFEDVLRGAQVFTKLGLIKDE